MDLQEMIDDQRWTEESHAAFLNWIEESFVYRMFNPNSKGAIGLLPSQQCSPAATCHDLPLNRLIPDSATESTQDSHPRPSRLRRVESGNRDLVVVTNTNGRRMRKRLLSQLNATHDQVVPQLGGEKKIRR